MPKIYEYLGLFFFFYANEHLPIHVHVTANGLESKFELEYENGKLKNVVVKKVAGKRRLNDKQENEAIKFVKKYHTGIVDKWKQFFVENKKVKCEIITKL
jgi:antitoxin component YwqK of YwqJK toxin-antitoxin module